MTPTDVQNYFERGHQALTQKDYAAAADMFKQVLSVDKTRVEALYNLGIIHHLQNELEQAIGYYRKAIALKPGFAQALFNLAHACSDLNRIDAAVAAYKTVLLFDPHNVSALYNLGNLYKSSGMTRQALDMYHKALDMDAGHTGALNNMGVIFKDDDQLDQALDCFNRVLSMDPAFVHALYNKGVVYQKKGAYEKGRACFARALRLNPHYAPAKWLHQLSLPMLYNTPEQIDSLRRRFTVHLHELVQSTPLDTLAERRQALDGVASTTNFFLQYQGRNDLDLQKQYGAFVTKIMAANYPQWSRPMDMPDVETNGKMRIGYVSSLLYSHTIGIFLLGWLQWHDRKAFEIYCYHVGTRTDDVTAQVKKHVDHFRHIPGNIETTASRIAKDRLHVLVHTDIGMNPVTTQLGALRLAPAQCKGWGHPVTTGLAAIDYYLSSDLMEPSDGDRHYSEILIRLPNLALSHQPPVLPSARADRAVFNLPRDRFVCLSTQSLYKYLPQHDDIYPAIAKQVPQALFVFIQNKEPEITSTFQARLAKAFKAAGMQSEAYCRFAPRLSHGDFIGLNQCADVLLDTLDWSGGKTTMEALWCGLPVVTLPGALMRSRHAHAFLKRLQLNAAIAESKADYIHIVTRLFTDKAFYSRVKEQIKNNNHLLFGDVSVVRALEAFYHRIGQGTDHQRQIQTKQATLKSCHPNTISPTPHEDGDPNPDALVRTHLEHGDQWHNQKDFANARIAFEKALAWITTHLGVQPWFERYLLDGRPPTHYQASFLSMLYQKIAQCRFKEERFSDSRNYCKTALGLDTGNLAAHDLLRRTEAIISKRGPRVDVCHPRGRVDAPAGDDFAAAGQLSILMLTHATDKLIKYSYLKSPETKLVEATYGSLIDVMGSDIIGACPKYLCFDRPQHPTLHHKRYEENLTRFARRHNFEFTAFDYCGLLAIVKTMTPRINTPYLLFLEHDWFFQSPSINLVNLLAVFNHNPDVHFVRFNKRPNTIGNFDFLLAREQTASHAQLLQTSAHSNNPAIWRVSRLKDRWLPLCLQDPQCLEMDLGGRTIGLENPLLKAHIKDIRRLGFTKAHANWGTYIYGGYDSGPHIIRLGE